MQQEPRVGSASIADHSQLHLPSGVTVEHVVQAVRQLCDPIGIALHGSRTRGKHDVFSDVDVLVVTRGASPSRAYRMIGDAGFDLLAGTSEELHAVLEGRSHTRDFEITLNASISAISIDDPLGVIHELQQHARQVWERGPRPLSAPERDMARARLVRLLHSAERLTVRSSSDSTHVLAGVVRSDYLVVECVYHYFRVHRRWTIDLPKLLMQLEEEGARLGQLCTAYGKAADALEKLQLARRIFFEVTRAEGLIGNSPR